MSDSGQFHHVSKPHFPLGEVVVRVPAFKYDVTKVVFHLCSFPVTAVTNRHNVVA